MFTGNPLVLPVGGRGGPLGLPAEKLAPKHGFDCVPLTNGAADGDHAVQFTTIKH